MPKAAVEAVQAGGWCDACVSDEQRGSVSDEERMCRI